MVIEKELGIFQGGGSIQEKVLFKELYGKLKKKQVLLVHIAMLLCLEKFKILYLVNLIYILLFC